MSRHYCYEYNSYGNNRYASEREQRRIDGYEREGFERRYDRDDITRPNLQHTHEFLDSVKIAEKKEDPHNHRFAGVTGQPILKEGNHYHLLKTNTDIYEDHIHEVEDRTSLAIFVGDGRHVHFVRGLTSLNDGHKHKYEFATLIDDPIGE